MEQSFQRLSVEPPFSDDDLELIELTEADIVEEGDLDMLVERVRPLHQPLDENPWDVVTVSPASEADVFVSDDLNEPLVAPEVEPIPVSAARDPLMTSTLAELYVSQGFIGKALDIYRGLFAASPDNVALASRISELEKQEHEAGAGSFQLNGGPTLSADAAAQIKILEGWLENIRRLKECR